MKLSISFFGSYPDVATAAAYDLILAASRKADGLGFTGVWFPERHFDPFGALSPNPAVLAAAISRETTRLRLRAGSVVLPLHHPIRVAEEWALVDQLSNGRVEVAFASGWHAQDFVLRPDAYGDRKATMWQAAGEVRALWRGEHLALQDGEGNIVLIKSFPRPVQAELPTWFAALGDPTTFREAARSGAGVLTNLIQQDAKQLADKIALYRAERKSAGLDPATGRIAVLMHCFTLDDGDEARTRAELPLRRYLESSVQLAGKMRRGGMGRAIDQLSDSDHAFLLDRAMQRYVNQQSLIGSPQQIHDRVDHLATIGVDEIACFVDFGLAPPDILRGIDALARHSRTGWLD